MAPTTLPSRCSSGPPSTSAARAWRAARAQHSCCCAAAASLCVWPPAPLGYGRPPTAAAAPPRRCTPGTAAAAPPRRCAPGIAAAARRRGRPLPRTAASLPGDDGDPASLFPSPATLALLALAAALGWAGFKVLLWDYEHRRTDDPTNPDRSDSFSIQPPPRKRREEGGEGAGLTPTPRWGLPPRPPAAPRAAPPLPPQAAALMARGLAAVAARRVVDLIREAAAALDDESGGGGGGGGEGCAGQPVVALAATASGRRAQARALLAAARARGEADPRGAALARVAELAAGDQVAELLAAAKGMGLD